MRAVILAGGQGTRLRPYTALIPKPLVPLTSEKAIVEVVIEQLVASGFTRITLAVNHFAKLIQTYFGNGAALGVQIDYVLEDHALGTMGPLALIEDLPGHFLVMNGDVLTDLHYGQFLHHHASQDSLFTISAFRREEKSEFGVLQEHDGFLTGFLEKPRTERLVSMGVYAMKRELLKVIPRSGPFGFDDLMLKMLKQNLPVRVEEWSGSWLDVGRPEDYEKAQALFEDS